MSALLDLAARCEAAKGPCRELDASIFATTTDERYTGKAPEPWPAYTASIDAAMTLAVEGISAADVLRHAIERCLRAVGMGDFTKALPRFVAGEWLRARAAQ